MDAVRSVHRKPRHGRRPALPNPAERCRLEPRSCRRATVTRMLRGDLLTQVAAQLPEEIRLVVVG